MMTGCDRETMAQRPNAVTPVTWEVQSSLDSIRTAVWSSLESQAQTTPRVQSESSKDEVTECRVAGQGELSGEMVPSAFPGQRATV